MFSNINEVWNNDTVKETTNKLLKKIPKENTDESLFSIDENAQRSLDERNISDLFKNKCENSMNHIKSCNKCFNKLIDIKVNKKINDLKEKNTQEKIFSLNQVILIIIGIIFFILIIILLIKLFSSSNR